jgi:hypothetical protein
MCCPSTGYQFCTIIHLYLTCNAHAHAQYIHLHAQSYAYQHELSGEHRKKLYGYMVPYYRLLVLYNHLYLVNLQCPCSLQMPTQSLYQLIKIEREE